MVFYLVKNADCLYEIEFVQINGRMMHSNYANWPILDMNVGRSGVASSLSCLIVIR